MKLSSPAEIIEPCQGFPPITSGKLRTLITEDIRKETTMFSFDYGLPFAIVIAMILFAWFSFFSVVFFG